MADRMHLYLQGEKLDGGIGISGARKPYTEVLSFDEETGRGLANWEGALIVFAGHKTFDEAPNTREDGDPNDG